MKEVAAELIRISNENNGILRAEDVIEAARPTESPLHNKFTWEDSQAAHLWRLEEARRLIRVTVQYIGGDKDSSLTRVFVSLKPDRQNEGGGYRTTVSVMSSAEMRKQMMKDAYEEMESFQQKYKMLQELEEVFKAMSTAKRKLIKQDLIAA